MTSVFGSSIEPLDKQTKKILNRKTNSQETLPAIDKYFAENREFLAYLPPPIHILNEINNENQGLVDKYIERLTYIETDLKWLLCLDYQHFWSQIIFDKSLKLLINSYLKYAPRPHDILKLNNLPKPVVDLHNSVQKLVFLVCLRMSTYKESKENFMTPEAFSNIVYNNYLFDIPKIIDICVLFKKNEILTKMIGNLFKTQEKYFSDFRTCLKDINKTFDTSKSHLVKIFDLDSTFNTNIKRENLPDRINSNLKSIIETIYYLTDFSISLNDFISVLPDIGEILAENQFQDKIKELIENVVFSIEDKLTKLVKETNDKNLKDSIKLIHSKLKVLKFQLAKLFKKIFEACSITPILRHADENNDKKKQDSKLQRYVDLFFQICSQMFEYEHFLCYYEEKFKLSEQVDIVMQLSGCHVEQSQHEYLIESLRTCVLNHSKKRSVKLRFTECESKRIETDSVTSKSTRVEATASVEIKSQSDLALKSILDMFPDKNVSLIKKCLKYYNNNVEEVINAFLENNIPEFPPETTEKIEDKKSGYFDYDNDDIDYEGLKIKQEDDFSGLNQRRNIYDDDDFDIFNKQAVDRSKIVFGKKNTTDTFDLDNKNDLNREFYKNYDHLMYQRTISEENPGEYEDEYDDTYDDNTNTAELETESFIKPLNQKLTTKKRDEFEADEDAEEDETLNEVTPGQQATASNSNQQAQNKFGFKQRGEQDSRNNQYSTKFQQSKPQQQQQRERDQPKQQRQNQQNYNQREDYRNNQRGSQHQPQWQRGSNQQQFGNNRDNDWNVEGNNQQQILLQRQRSSNQQQFRNNRDNNSKGEGNNQQQNQQQWQRGSNQQQFRDNRDNNLKNEGNNQQQNQQQNKPLPQRQNKQRNKDRNFEEDEPKQLNEVPEADAAPVAKTEEEIKRERRWKNENKSKTVHHNRKDLAAKKMNFF